MKIITPYKNTHEAFIREAIVIHVNRKHVYNDFPSLELPFETIIRKIFFKNPIDGVKRLMRDSKHSTNGRTKSRGGKIT